MRLDLKAPVVPRPDTDHTGPFISPDRLASMPMARSPIYLAGQTGIDANGKVAEGFRAQGFRVRMRSHRRALKSIEAVKIRRVGRSEWMWRLAAGAE